MPPLYDSVRVGDELPPLVLPPLTGETLALYAGAAREHKRIDVDFNGWFMCLIPDVVAHGMLSMAWIGRLLTNWAPQREMREFSVRFTALTCAGERIVCTGRIAEKLERDGERLVRVAVATVNEAGEVKVAGDAYLSLP